MIATVALKQQFKNHDKVAAVRAASALLIHQYACEALLHVITLGTDGKPFGDVSACFHLYTALGGKDPSSDRTGTLKSWFKEMSGDQMTAEKGVWKMKKGWSIDKFQMELAEKTPYYSRTSDPEAKAYSLSEIMKFLNGIPKRIQKAQEKDKFQGDAAKITALVVDMTQYLTEKAKRLSAQESGVLEAQADKILAAAPATMEDAAPVSVAA
jgi:hypothetical protein